MADESTPYEPGNLASFLEDALVNLSHELRTPLAVAKGNTTSLIRHDHLLTREERIEILGEIETACDRLETVIQQTLQTAHVLRGSVSLQREPVNLTAVTQQAINAVARYFADTRSAPVEIHTDNTPCIVWADADWVERAIVQLLDNAWRYSPEDRPIAITIHANPQQPTVEWSISDQGLGISATDLALIFTPFYRVERRPARATSGLGLGLALCQRIITMQGGTLTATSTPNVGSQFTFTLPRYADDTTAPTSLAQ